MRTDPSLSPESLLSQLERELRTAQDLAIPFDTFDLLVTQPGFIEASELTTSPLLDGVLDHLARKLDGPTARWHWAPCLLRNAEQAILHGLARVGQRHCAIFHLQRADIGVAAVFGGGPQVHHVRFTQLVLPAGVGPARGRGAA
jgi:hypothetical protein